MIQKVCPYCQGDSYSSYYNPHWICPYCGKDIGNIDDKDDDIGSEKQNADLQRSAIGRKNIISSSLYTTQSIK